MITSNGFYDDTLSLYGATTFLRELLMEFPFSDWRDELPPQAPEDARFEVEHGRQARSQAVQLAAMLSQFAGGLLPPNEMRLGFIYNANSQRSGKTLLVKLAIVPPNARMAVQSWNAKEEELRKVIDAECLRASRYIVFDNVRGHVASPVLEAFMTTPVWTGRILAQSKMFEASNLSTIFITGNDMTVSPDMAFRCLICDLFVQEANVQERRVTTPITDSWLMLKSTRMRILNALSCIVRHWDEAGRPKASKNLRAGFERWCEVFGGMVEFAGFGDCLAMPTDVESDVNTEGADMKGLVTMLAKPVLAGDTRRLELRFQDVVNGAHEGGFFDWMLDGKLVDKEEDREPGVWCVENGVFKEYVLKPDSTSRFGKLLKRYAPQTGARIFRVTPEQSVRVSCTGKNRQRRYVIERPV